MCVSRWKHITQKLIPTEQGGTRAIEGSKVTSERGVLIEAFGGEGNTSTALTEGAKPTAIGILDESNGCFGEGEGPVTGAMTTPSTGPIKFAPVSGIDPFVDAAEFLTAGTAQWSRFSFLHGRIFTTGFCVAQKTALPAPKISPPRHKE